MAATENKFGHLLQPIRDLAQNWNVNVAEELEDYLEELESFHFSLEDEGSATGMNFAEAALLIQGSASVYSKKVEYLHSLVYAALEAIAEKRSARQRVAEQEGAEAGGDGSDADTEEQFLTLDDVIEGGAEIDLPEGGSATAPLTALRPPASLALLGECNGPISTSRFQTATHSSGAMLLDPSELLQPHARSRLGPQPAAAEPDALAAERLEGGGGSDDEGWAGDCGDWGGASPGLPPDAGLPLPQQPLPCASPGPPSPEAEEVPWEDPYEPLLPHEAGGLPNAPFRLRIPTRRSVRKADGEDSGLGRLIRVAPLSTVALREFAPHLAASQAAAAGSRQAAPAEAAEPFSPDEGGGEGAWDGYASDGSAPGDWPHEDGAASPVLGWDGGEAGDVVELVTAALPEYTAAREEQAAAATAAGQLEVRVKAWQAGIQPHLEEQDARPAFDIKAYGERIVATIAAEVGRETWVSFGAVASQQQHWEVTRLFASMLQLINAGTLAIAKA